jgi:ribosomal protein S18 acetylase RimI-like enzyme
MEPHPEVTLDLDGYTELPPGKIAAVVTYLEMRRRPSPREGRQPDGLTLQRINHDVRRYKALFRAVGLPWLWFGRLVMPEEELAGLLGDPEVEAYALHDGRADIGLLELDFRPEGEAELSYFGVVPAAIGTGAGRFLMHEALARAFARPIRRFFVHTCSLDHPGAVGFYMRSGFTPYKRAIEVADDPRLLGVLPPDAALQVPLIGERTSS